MALIIEWSDDAIKQLKSLYGYLEDQWTDKEIKNFTKKLDNQLKLISSQPRLYKNSERLHGVRECVITKHNTIFYVYNETTLYILILWSNNMGDNKLKP